MLNIPKGNVMKSHMPRSCPKQITLSSGEIPISFILRTKIKHILSNNFFNYVTSTMFYCTIFISSNR